MQTRPIEIDIEVFRWLENQRQSFDQTYNDILRGVAGLASGSSGTVTTSVVSKNGDASRTGAWSRKGATLPSGTKLRMTYSGSLYTGVVEGGALHVNGGQYVSPSAAAGAVTGHSINGWDYWQVQLAGTDKWQPISKFRTQAPTRRSKITVDSI